MENRASHGTRKQWELLIRPCLAKIISPDCTNNQDSDYFCQTRTLIIIIAIII
jgi:hypothetical protein